MTIDEFKAKTEEYQSGDDYVHTSPDFQCDQTGGYPTMLCAAFNEEKAWLVLNDSFSDVDLSEYEQMCADWGIRDCPDWQIFNKLLIELGEDAYQCAYLTPDEFYGASSYASPPDLDNLD